MKCIILAGGSGNRLWPLSRNNYPKQFINIKNNHSLFQETIVRNMPFCDEFIVVTNKKYSFIIEAQLQIFQGLKYRCVYEEEARKTSAAITLTCMLYNPSEQVLIVPADHIINNGSKYRAAILEAQTFSKTGSIVAFGIEPQSPHTGYGYIQYKKNKVLSFHEKPNLEKATDFLKEGNYYWNSGLYLFYIGDFLNSLKIYAYDLYHKCYTQKNRIVKKGYEVIFPKELLQSIPAQNIEIAFIEKCKDLQVVKSDFDWHYVQELESLCSETPDNREQNAIQNNCINTSIINQAKGKLVVTNELNDILVVNTPDAIYVSKKGSAFQIKNVIRSSEEMFQPFFEDNLISYRPWGTYELLKIATQYKVKKVTVFPGKSLTLHKHHHRSEHWAIVEGTATITLEDNTKQYYRNDSIDVPIGTLHQIANESEIENLVIIETSIGDFLTETDIENTITGIKPHAAHLEIVKLDPSFKDYLWGGTKLRDVYHKDCDYDIIAESWELSAHPDGNSVISSGMHKGMFFADYLSLIGNDALGWKCKAFETFPLLIKFIDARKALSVQVHPNDDYALKYENEYGKNEMWYVMDCDDNAYLYYGFKEAVTKEEIYKRIHDNTITEVLNKVTVHKGDVFFVNAGTVHAIGAGIMICEIQQNSNSTYRLYDYERKDKYGNLRDLHLDKALDVISTEPVISLDIGYKEDTIETNYTKQYLGGCKYFECIKYTIITSLTLLISDASFASLTIIEGSGEIHSDALNQTLNFNFGQSFFIPAGIGNLVIHGPCTFIFTHI